MVRISPFLMSFRANAEKHDFWDAFKNGHGEIFVIGNGQSPIAGFPGFTFRKIDARRIALLAWRDLKLAEDWMTSYGMSSEDFSYIVPLNFASLEELLEKHPNMSVELH